jgi:recombinational DNA repair protein RecT
VSFRGLIVLCQRAGYRLRAIAVYKGDTIGEDGVLNLTCPTPPAIKPVMEGRQHGLDAMLGVIVVGYRLEDNALIDWSWMDVGEIKKRRDCSDAWKKGQKQDAEEWARSSPWYKWEDEMALKTAIKAFIMRGGIPTDDAIGRAMSADVEDSIVQEPPVVTQHKPLQLGMDSLQGILAGGEVQETTTTE